MVIKVVLALLSCSASIGCTFRGESKQLLKSSDIKPNDNSQVTGIYLAKNPQKLVNSDLLPTNKFGTESSQALSTKLPSSEQWQPSKDILAKAEQKNYDSEAQLTAIVKTDNYITLESTGRTNALGNPLYRTHLGSIKRIANL